MTLPSNVKSSFFYNVCIALYPKIYLPINVYNDLKSENPNPYNLAILIHEQTHIKRYEEVGVVKWVIKYVLDPKFRIDEELIAHGEGMRFIKSKNLIWNFEKTAKNLSSWLYLWPISYKEALARLKKIWNSV